MPAGSHGRADLNRWLDPPRASQDDRGVRGLVAVTLTLACALGCSDVAAPGEPEATRVDAAASLPAPVLLEPGVIGCDLLFDAGGCWRRRAGPLSLWVAGGSTSDELWPALDGRPLAPEHVRSFASPQGVLLRVVELPARGRLSLLASDERRELARVELSPLPAAYLRAEQDAEARELVRAGGEPLAYAIDSYLLFVKLVSPRASEAGQAERDAAAIERELARLVLRAERLGEQRRVGTVLLTAASIWIGRAHYEAAARALALVRAGPARRVPVHAVEADQLDATLSGRIGLDELALEQLERAEALALALHVELSSDADLLPTLIHRRALSLAAIGRYAEATALAAELEGWRFVDPDTQLDIRNNLAWMRVLAREDDHAAPSVVAEYVALVADDPRPTTWLNLAIASSQVGELARGDAMLARLEPEALAPGDRVWFELASARLALVRRPGAWDEARGHLDRAALAAERSGGLDELLRVRIDRATLEADAGELDAARREFERADALADRLALRIDGSSGRSMLSSVRSHARARHVELLLELDDRPAALCTVLAGRARHLRGLSVGAELGSRALLDQHRAAVAEHRRRRAALDERRSAAETMSARARTQELAAIAVAAQELDALLLADRRALEREPPPWRCEALRPTQPRAALLAFTPGRAPGSWHVLLDRAGTVEHRRIELAADAPLESLARAAFTQLDAALRGVELLTVIPTGPLARVDMQVLAPPTMQVVHGLGLGAAPREAGGRRDALVLVGDGGLVHADREAEQVRDTLLAAGFALLEWPPSDIQSLELMHFAGHGEREGTAGWRSRLRLRAGELLDGSEVIASRRAPRIVVLGACSAAATSPELIDGGMNMAFAFLLAGAELVIAPDREVDDALAEQLAALLYADLEGDAAAEPARWIARLAAAKRADPSFSPWRAWVR